jgi:F-type H+-transporting ATPase subunit b
MRKSSTFLSLLLSGATATMSLPALAEEGAAKAGLPQLDVSRFPEQLFWLAISFTALYVAMRYVALPGVQRVQDKRKGVIELELAAARTANDQAKAMAVQSEKALAAARSKAHATINDIKTQTANVAADQQAAQSKTLHQKLREAEAGIAVTRDNAFKEIEKSAKDLAAVIVETVSGLKVKA